jgi:hypothetical protein
VSTGTPPSLCFCACQAPAKIFGGSSKKSGGVPEKFDEPPNFPAPRRKIRRAIGKFGEALCFPARRRNFRQAVGKSGGVPEN